MGNAFSCFSVKTKRRQSHDKSTIRTFCFNRQKRDAVKDIEELGNKVLDDVVWKLEDLDEQNEKESVSNGLTLPETLSGLHQSTANKQESKVRSEHPSSCTTVVLPLSACNFRDSRPTTPRSFREKTSDTIPMSLMQANEDYSKRMAKQRKLTNDLLKLRNSPRPDSLRNRLEGQQNTQALTIDSETGSNNTLTMHINVKSGECPIIILTGSEYNKNNIMAAKSNIAPDRAVSTTYTSTAMVQQTAIINNIRIQRSPSNFDSNYKTLVGKENNIKDDINYLTELWEAFFREFPVEIENKQNIIQPNLCSSYKQIEYKAGRLGEITDKTKDTIKDYTKAQDDSDNKIAVEVSTFKQAYGGPVGDIDLKQLEDAFYREFSLENYCDNKLTNKDQVCTAHRQSDNDVLADVKLIGVSVNLRETGKGDICTKNIPDKGDDQPASLKACKENNKGISEDDAGDIDLKELEKAFYREFCTDNKAFSQPREYVYSGASNDIFNKENSEKSTFENSKDVVEISRGKDVHLKEYEENNVSYDDNDPKLGKDNISQRSECHFVDNDGKHLEESFNQGSSVGNENKGSISEVSPGDKGLLNCVVAIKEELGKDKYDNGTVMENMQSVEYTNLKDDSNKSDLTIEVKMMEEKSDCREEIENINLKQLELPFLREFKVKPRDDDILKIKAPLNLNMCENQRVAIAEDIRPIPDKPCYKSRTWEGKDYDNITDQKDTSENIVNVDKTQVDRTETKGKAGDVINAYFDKAEDGPNRYIDNSSNTTRRSGEENADMVTIIEDKIMTENEFIDVQVAKDVKHVTVTENGDKSEKVDLPLNIVCNTRKENEESINQTGLSATDVIERPSRCDKITQDIEQLAEGVNETVENIDVKYVDTEDKQVNKNISDNDLRTFRKEIEFNHKDGLMNSVHSENCRNEKSECTEGGNQNRMKVYAAEIFQNYVTLGKAQVSIDNNSNITEVKDNNAEHKSKSKFSDITFDIEKANAIDMTERTRNENVIDDRTVNSVPMSVDNIDSSHPSKSKVDKDADGNKTDETALLDSDAKSDTCTKLAMPYQKFKNRDMSRDCTSISNSNARQISTGDEAYKEENIFRNTKDMENVDQDRAIGKYNNQTGGPVRNSSGDIHEQCPTEVNMKNNISKHIYGTCDVEKEREERVVLDAKSEQINTETEISDKNAAVNLVKEKENNVKRIITRSVKVRACAVTKPEIRGSEAKRGVHRPEPNLETAVKARNTDIQIKQKPTEPVAMAEPLKFKSSQKAVLQAVSRDAKVDNGTSSNLSTNQVGKNQTMSKQKKGHSAPSLVESVKFRSSLNPVLKAALDKGNSSSNLSTSLSNQVGRNKTVSKQKKEPVISTEAIVKPNTEFHQRKPFRDRDAEFSQNNGTPIASKKTKHAPGGVKRLDTKDTFIKNAYEGNNDANVKQRGPDRGIVWPQKMEDIFSVKEKAYYVEQFQRTELFRQRLKRKQQGSNSWINALSQFQIWVIDHFATDEMEEILNPTTKRRQNNTKAKIVCWRGPTPIPHRGRGKNT